MVKIRQNRKELNYGKREFYKMIVKFSIGRYLNLTTFLPPSFYLLDYSIFYVLNGVRHG